MMRLCLFLTFLVSSQIASAADVFAHFMVANAYAFDVTQWETDMKAARQIGVDGFALNWISPDCIAGQEWMVDRIADAFTAAEHMDFKLMHSFDMSYTTCNIFWNSTFMSTILSRHAGSSAAYRWNSNLLVSTFGGDVVSEYGNNFFQDLKNAMKDSHAISLAPALTTYAAGAQQEPVAEASKMLSDYPSIDGYLNWQAWPLNVRQNISITPDKAIQSALKKAGRTGPYIMAVSPWQYKDLNDGNPMDSWVQYSDTLFSHRFESLLGEDAIHPDIIELLTWNDFGESHYLRNLPPQHDMSAPDFIEMGDMGPYVWGQNHAPWRIMAKYYISWWKNGSPPEITMDQVVYWYRIHPKATICTGGSSVPIRNHLFPEDAVFAWALVKDKATISMSVGSNEYWTFEADGSGPSMNMVPFPLDIWGGGVTPKVAIIRDGKQVQHGQGSRPITSACAWQNFNPVVNLVGPGINSGW